MSLFVVDTAGDNHLLINKIEDGTLNTKKTLLTEKPSCISASALPDEIKENENIDDSDFFGLPPPDVDLSKIIDKTLSVTTARKSKVVEAMNQASENLQAAIEKAKAHPKSKRKIITELDHSDFNVITGKFNDDQFAKINVEKEMSTTKMVPGFEQIKELPSLSKKKQRDLNRLERKKTKGAGWFNLPSTEITRELRNDLRIIQMRSVLDPKHFYKKNDLKVLPKYFQVGTVQHSPLDYYNERDTRRNKKRSIVDEMLADAEVQKFTKRKYNEILERPQTLKQRKALMKMKKLKKKKK